MEGYVYFLADPRKPRHPRYIGATKDPVVRAHDHSKLTSSSNRALTQWKHDLRAEGLSPMLVVISRFATRDAATDAEWRLMHRLRRRGLADLNTEKEGRASAWALQCEARQGDWS